MNDLGATLEFLRDLPSEEAPRFWEIAPGRRMAWNEYGDPAGSPVFYYHGWPSSRLQARMAHHLARQRGIRLVAMDRPGMGQSTDEIGRTLESWPELMVRFADALEIGKFGQLGISGGGPYVLACAARIPQRLTGSAVLAGAVPLGELAIDQQGLHPVYRLLIPFRKLPGRWFSGVFGAAALAARSNPKRPPWSWALRTLAAEDRRLLLDYPDVWKVITRSFQEGVAHGGGRGVMTDAAIYFQPLPWKPESIHHPIRYWHGGEDRNIPLAMAREFIQKIAGASLRIDESLGHFSLVLRRAPAALDHLAQCAAQGGD